MFPGRRFENARVFITGASAGIGASLAVAFAREGARVAFAARRKEKLQAVKARIDALGGESIIVPCDVTSRHSIDAAVSKTVETFGGLDIAVANAGFGVSGVFTSLRTEDFRRQFDTNFFGLVDTIYATLPRLRETKGQLVLVGSVLGRFGTPGSPAYGSSKFAVVGLAESIYYELADLGIAVTCINPGTVESDFRRTDNEGTFTPDREDYAPSWLRVPTERAVRAMLKAIYARKTEAVVTGHGRFLVTFARHFPRTFRFIVRMVTRGRMNAIDRLRGKPASSEP